MMVEGAVAQDVADRFDHVLVDEYQDTNRLQASILWAEVAEEGGFVAYGPRLVQIFRELVARQLVQLLRGVKPADIPIEQPTKFELWRV